jgi:hypothetical protein
MLILFIKTCILILFSLIAFQDFRENKFSVVLFLLLSLASISLTIISVENNFDEFYLHAIINTISNIIILLVTFLYIKITSKSNLINKKLGFGDILFMFLLGFSFSSINYIVLLLCSFIIAILYTLILAIIKKEHISTIKIPLVSMFCISFGSYLLLSMLFPFNYYWHIISHFA